MKKLDKIDNLYDGISANGIYSPDGICPTITSRGFQTLIREDGTMKELKPIGNLYDYNGQNGGVFSPDSIAPTVIGNAKCVAKVMIMAKDKKQILPAAIRTRTRGGELEIRDGREANALTSVRKDSLAAFHTGKHWRIRHITERESLRLMDVGEPEIDTLLSSGISSTQLYKLAGNSIVVACLYHIFRKIFIEPDNEEKQLTLF